MALIAASPTVNQTFHAPDFHLEATLESGQTFGFTCEKKGYYCGYIDGYTVSLKQKNEHLFVVSESEIPKSTLRQYFDLDRDLSPVYAILQEDKKLFPAFQKYKGMRLIQQNPWEVIACFIISANNNVKRIQGIWRNLSKNLSPSQYLFPKAHELAKTNEKALRSMGLGYRAPYLLATAKIFDEDNTLIQKIKESPYEDAKQILLQCPGIGPKVADCILLYGFQKYEAFPVDVWISRAMKKLYYRGRKASDKQICELAHRKWKSLAGYIQQYIFHASRNSII